MLRLRFALLALALLVLPPGARAAEAPSDPAARQIAEGVMRSLGGRQRWDALPGIRWSFGLSTHDTVRFERRHSWDKMTGRHRVAGTLRNGARFVIVHTLGDTLRGHAWIEGRAIQGDSLHTLLRQGEAMWVNDSYWFLMPYKLLDPGVHLKYDGVVTDSAGTFKRIELTFGHVGLTPGDHYWVDVNPKTMRVERWQYVLQGSKPPPEHWTWQGWEQHDGLWFATEHRQGDTVLFTRDVETVHAFRPHEFTAP